MPLSEITSAFYKLYHDALTYTPVLSSTPFHGSASWADVFCKLPGEFQHSLNPAHLLSSLLDDDYLLTRFIFASFLPNRFYGGFSRYPKQLAYIEKWLSGQTGCQLKILDIACGTGEDLYTLALRMMKKGRTIDFLKMTGWTLDPLEAWSAKYRRFPHDSNRELYFRDITNDLFLNRHDFKINFTDCNLLSISAVSFERFDIVICNGLLGGPIINLESAMQLAVKNLHGLLKPGGILLTADSFHQGWKQKCPQGRLQALLEYHGLSVSPAGEGLSALKSD